MTERTLDGVITTDRARGWRCWSRDLIDIVVSYDDGTILWEVLSWAGHPRLSTRTPISRSQARWLLTRWGVIPSPWECRKAIFLEGMPCDHSNPLICSGSGHPNHVCECSCHNVMGHPIMDQEGAPF